jgi:hypothetical protein
VIALKEAEVSCIDGIIHFIYIFFRTDAVVLESGMSERLCNAILDIYRIPEDREKKAYWNTNKIDEFQNLGLRIILTSGLSLTNFEIFYIQDCLIKDPFEDCKILFNTMMNGTLYNGINNLDNYLNILFGLKDKDAIIDVLSTIMTSNDFDESFKPQDFIMNHKILVNKGSTAGAIQIQKIIELFLLCLKLKNENMQNLLVNYFYRLPTHDKMQQKIISRMRDALAGGERV